ncbi:MAG: hypothetical protein ACREQY_11390, partial [Candidatus Binatia bacterium]
LRNSVVRSLGRRACYFASTAAERERFEDQVGKIERRSVIGGHVPLPRLVAFTSRFDLDWSYFTILRDPVDWVLSTYHFVTTSDYIDHSASKNQSFEDFLRGRPNMCWWIAPEATREAARRTLLANEVAVFTLPEFPRLIRELAVLFARNVSELHLMKQRRVEAPPDLAKLILDFDPLREDYLLYLDVLRGEFRRSMIDDQIAELAAPDLTIRIDALESTMIASARSAEALVAWRSEIAVLQTEMLAAARSSGSGLGRRPDLRTEESDAG